MFARRFSILASSLVLAACSSGLPSPPALAYALPTPSEARYRLADTSAVSISMMGQSLELAQDGVADYVVTFESARDGIVVRLTVAELAATIKVPMGAPVRLDRTDVSGELVFTLDRRGNSTISEHLVVSDVATQMISNLALAHTFFPGLPGRAVAVEDSWVDTLSYEGSEGAGTRSERRVIRYTVVGDTIVAGRSLLVISLQGTAESTADMEFGGMAVKISSNVDVTGHVLWDVQGGLMFESVNIAIGSGNVSVPVAPVPLPIEVRSTRRIRLQGR